MNRLQLTIKLQNKYYLIFHIRNYFLCTAIYFVLIYKSHTKQNIFYYEYNLYI